MAPSVPGTPPRCVPGDAEGVRGQRASRVPGL